ncbi:hypothetical protein BH10BDE1_BH10BDE1_26360 [soil metagenome]
MIKKTLVTFLIGAVLFLVGQYGLGRKPSERSLVNLRAKEPIQVDIPADSPEAKTFSIAFEKNLYTIYPKATYSIEGLVVSQHRSDSLFDLMHTQAGDTLNSRDICTVWGQMLAAGVYRDIEFWSGDFTCNYRFSGLETAAVFHPNEFSNTHVLSRDAEVRRQLNALETGDEYRMTGRLVDYDIYPNGRRNSSLVRTDTGEHACEVMLVDSVEILKSHNKIFHTMSLIGYWLALISLFAIFATMFRTIFFRRAIFILFALGLGTLPKSASAKICDSSSEYCGDWGGSSSSSTSSTSRGTKIKLNPAVIPVTKGLGIETIIYDGGVDFALVKGLGRVGAAISPSNSEETFFGPPGFEDPLDLQDRKVGHHKFPAQKYTLATAVGLFDNKKTSYDRLSINVGIMGKYNKLTSAITPGAGVSAVAGPVTLAYSRYSDQTQVDSRDPAAVPSQFIYRYNVETFSVGAYIDSLAIDYSNLKLIPDDYPESTSTVQVITATWLFKRAILTAAQRTESFATGMFSYNYETRLIEVVTKKVEYFGGFQYAVFDPLLVGVFYNYYLERDISIGATFFF